MGDEKQELRQLGIEFSAIYLSIITSTNPAVMRTKHENAFDKAYRAYIALAEKCGIPEIETQDIRDMYKRIFG
ncbi:MAG TPA: hypothetical protein VI612_02125 [Candidatus Nanoarchaeia archaeon]|nr:hypothetical protein [Candidatus Nanoarchaeia archaeon]